MLLVSYGSRPTFFEAGETRLARVRHGHRVERSRHRLGGVWDDPEIPPVTVALDYLLMTPHDRPCQAQTTSGRWGSSR
jgi:hypothetical protein